jgi:hypothetical protein
LYDLVALLNINMGILDQWYLEQCCIWLWYTHSCWLFIWLWYTHSCWLFIWLWYTHSCWLFIWLWYTHSCWLFIEDYWHLYFLFFRLIEVPTLTDNQSSLDSHPNNSPLQDNTREDNSSIELSVNGTTNGKSHLLVL